MTRASGENESAISIIAAGMKIVGDCETDGTVRIEGRLEGTIRAGKSVVVGRGGEVVGDIFTQDAVISGHVNGNIVAESRLELQATSDLEGEIRSRRVKLDEGAKFNGQLRIEEATTGAAGKPKDAGAGKPKDGGPAAARPTPVGRGDEKGSKTPSQASTAD